MRILWIAAKWTAATTVADAAATAAADAAATTATDAATATATTATDATTFGGSKEEGAAKI